MSDQDQAWAAPENAPAPESAPAQVEQAAAPEQETQEKTVVKEEKVVPLQALHEARATNRQLREQMKQHEEWRRTAEARLNEIYRSQQPKPPEFEADPANHLKHGLEQQAATLRALENEVLQKRQAEHLNAQQAELVNWGKAQADEYRKADKEFDSAYTFIRERRKSELTAVGLSPQEAEAEVTRNELWLIANAYQQGKNPAELVMSMARSTGYQPKAARTPEQQIDTLQKGVEASKSIGKGGQKPVGVSMEDLANMSKTDFDAAMKSGIWDRLAG